MIYWIESQPTTLIAVLAFAFCYALAAGAFFIADRLSARPAADELKTITPVTLTTLGMILGLLIAFLAARVWENVGHANEYVSREATALSEVVLLANALPPEIRGKLRSSIKQHVQFIETQDWPAMAKMSADLRVEPAALTEAQATLLAYAPTQPNQQLAQQRAVMAIERAYQARRDRIRVSRAEIAPIQWGVIILLAAMILLTMALIHIGRRTAMAATLCIFASAFATCLMLLLVYDRPFADGGVSMTPAKFREINLD